MENQTRLLSFDEAWDYLNEVAEGIPPDIFKGLNGGIVLQPEIKMSPHSIGGDLFTLGMYHYDPLGLGRYITIYYGSFVQVHGRQRVARQKKALREVLYHEFVHHLESLAGVRDLEEADKRFLQQYFRSHEKDAGEETG